ncbi:MAG: hypothetical protein ACFWUE_06755 [Xylanivirga thermophila]|jgi:hypothetical protein|uniref:hypothetical protein n=1 Tax=Xylanivirga thermophila TaxID=2496273 RepID=UPI00101DD2F4|nr:hypothetical protein [Xylanivirga thermophila]
MYLDTYMAILVWTFAIFGFIFFIIKLFEEIQFKKDQKANRYGVILWTKDCQSAIEGVVRAIMLRTKSDGRDEILNNLIIIDGGSKDDTIRIIEKLSQDYCFIKIMDKDELGELDEKISELFHGLK